jgi:hypothetical protein
VLDPVEAWRAVSVEKRLRENGVRDGNDRVFIVEFQELVHKVDDLVILVIKGNRIGHVDHDVVTLVAGSHDRGAGRDPRAGTALLRLDSSVHGVS